MRARIGSVKLDGLLRVMALGCILASAPVAFLKYPWLPATLLEFAELQHDPAPWGTRSYHVGRAQRLERVQLALLLNALGTVSLCGLVAIVAKALPWWAELATWSVIAVTGLGFARFEIPIMPGTNPAYLLMTVYLPLGIAVIAAVAVVFTFGSQVQRKLAAEVDR